MSRPKGCKNKPKCICPPDCTGIPDDGTEGQDRDNYTDTQDRENYVKERSGMNDEMSLKKVKRST
jgi:hypothetical protein